MYFEKCCLELEEYMEIFIYQSLKSRFLRYYISQEKCIEYRVLMMHNKLSIMETILLAVFKFKQGF